MCVNYRGLNQITIKNWYLLSLILGLLDQLNHAKIYTNIDLCGAYNLVHIGEGDEWKTTCRTCYSHFEYVVMPFGLTNAPIFFNIWWMMFFVNIWMILWSITSMTSSFSLKNGKPWTPCTFCFGFQKLQKISLYAKLEKCGFHQFEVEFLGYIISRDCVCMDPRKVQTVVDWATPTFVRNVQCFLRFANFYR
jgi:hypothetical protein